MTHEEYTRLPGVTATLLKAGAKSMLHMRHAALHPPAPTSSMRLGTLVHAAILGTLDYAVWTGGRRAGKEWETFKAGTPPEQEIVTEQEIDAANAAAAAVRARQDACELLNGGQQEVVVQWQEQSGPAKARIDSLLDNAVVELKTTSDITVRAFESQAFRLGYHIQLGWYREAARSTGREIRDVWVVAVESQPPHDVAVYRANPFLLAHGIDEARRIHARWAECERTGKYPGIQGDAELALALPAFVIADIELED